MSTSHRRRFIVVTLSTLFVFAASSYANHSWNGYHWARASNPIVLQLGDNVHSAWDSYLVEAELDWEASSVLALSIVPGSTSTKRCNPDTGEIEVCADRYGRTGWLGVAGVWVSGSHITKAYTKLNDTYFNTATYNTPGWRRLVMCQEVGHDFGLAHQDETFGNTNLGSCMDYTDDPDGTEKNQLSNEHPNQHDYDQLESMYGHSDSSSLPFDGVSASMMRPSTMEEILINAGQWGTPIRFDGQGRPNLFELEIGVNAAGEKEKVFTHVFWIPGEDRGRPVSE